MYIHSLKLELKFILLVNPGSILQEGLRKVQDSGVYLKVGETFSDIGESIEEFKKTIQKVKYHIFLFFSYLDMCSFVGHGVPENGAGTRES